MTIIKKNKSVEGENRRRIVQSEKTAHGWEAVSARAAGAVPELRCEEWRRFPALRGKSGVALSAAQFGWYHGASVP